MTNERQKFIKTSGLAKILGVDHLLPEVDEELSDEELKLWNCEDESPEIIEAFNKSVTNMPKAKKNESIYTDEELGELDTWKSPPSKKRGTFIMKAQYKGRSKPLLYVLDEDKEDD